ncbi:hypothetical protein EDD11_003817 [Mortierella claussenii]|nr:hypothetical protein EDD11_003817 [Mortierella claussenii]
MSTQRPTAESTFSSTISPSSSNSNISNSSNAFKYAVYQPPPARESDSSVQQQQQQQQHEGVSSSLAIDYHQLLEPEQFSSGTSTLVGSPIPPRFEASMSGRHPWAIKTDISLSQTYLSSLSSPSSSSSAAVAGTKEHLSPAATAYMRVSSSSSVVASTFRFGAFRKRIRRFSQQGGKGTFNYGSLLDTDASNFLRYRDNRYYHDTAHISVAMDDISLDNFAEDAPSMTAHDHRNDSSGTYSNNDREATSQSQRVTSSNASMITLLAHNSGGDDSQKDNSISSRKLSGSSTLWRGLLSRTRSSSARFQHLQELNVEVEPRRSPPQHQTIALSNPEGKVYSKRPNPKGLGGKKAGNKAMSIGGDKGNGDRKALFSNERTFIHWIKFGILLGTTALTLCNFGTEDTLAFDIGVAVLAIAMLALGYAAVVFHRRDRSLSRRLRARLTRTQNRLEANTTMDKRIQQDNGKLDLAIVSQALLPSLEILTIMREGSTSKAGGGLSFFHQE